MFYSLGFRIIVMSILVAVTAVASVGLLSRSFTITEFEEYVAMDEDRKLEAFALMLAKEYERRGDWSGAQTILEQVGNTSDKQLILVDEKRRVLAASPAEILEDDIRISPEHSVQIERKDRAAMKTEKLFLLRTPFVSLRDSRGVPIAFLYSVALPSLKPGENERAFAASLTRALALAGLISAVLASLIGFFLARKIVRPVESLTRAAREMENGDLNCRVEVSSKDEIGELARAFNSMADNLARLEQLRSDMVSDVAHELRTPLTNIRCRLEAVQDRLVEPDSETINSIYEEAILLNRLVDDLQDVALAEAGQMCLWLEQTSVQDVITQAVSALQPRFASGGWSIKIEIPNRCPDVFADPQRLGQILRNLLVNAAQHTPPEGTIIVSAVAPNDSEVEFSVKDTGDGIAPEDLPFVFERFYRADQSRSRATGGSGLGLAIVKQIVLTHGGHIRVESKTGAGTKIIFTIPTLQSAS